MRKLRAELAARTAGRSTATGGEAPASQQHHGRAVAGAQHEARGDQARTVPRATSYKSGASARIEPTEYSSGRPGRERR